MNIKLYKRILTQIKTHPETWDQTWWHGECGTTHCFAGWAEAFAGYDWGESNVHDTIDRAKQALWLTDDGVSYLFHSSRTLKDFEEYLAVELHALNSMTKEVA